MIGNEGKRELDEVRAAEPEKSYRSPDLIDLGSAEKVLQDTFSQKYREVTSRYTTYWG